MTDLEDIKNHIDDRWDLMPQKNNEEFIKELYKMIETLIRKGFDINLKTDLGFGYTVEQTIGHIQDDDKEGKMLMDRYARMIAEYRRLKLGLL